MQIVFSDGKTVDLLLADTPLSAVYKKIYKHLQHVTIPFREWDNPYFSIGLDHETRVDKLCFYGKKLSLKIDKQLCLQQDQQYLNHIHKVYEDNYNGDVDWLHFNEYIHLCEKKVQKKKLEIFQIDYADKAGMLETPVDPEWFKNNTTKIKAGDVFVSWSELGKTPYDYWKHNEPNDISSMCNSIKPWLKLKPKILVALEDMDKIEGIEVEQFNSWWKNYQQEWCQHWNIAKWDIDDIFSVTLFGRVPDVETIKTQLKNHINPDRVLI
jgi:hypothetical protein